MKKAKGCLAETDVRFVQNLRHQESERWAEYLERRTQESLAAWRQSRKQIRQMRGHAA
jgi:hypothetical protein